MNAARFKRVNRLKASLLAGAVGLALVGTAKAAGAAFPGLTANQINLSNTPETDGTPNWGRILGAPFR